MWNVSPNFLTKVMNQYEDSKTGAIDDCYFDAKDQLVIDNPKFCRSNAAQLDEVMDKIK